MINRNRALGFMISAVSMGLFLSAMTFADESYSPNVDRNYPENVYWGDTHLHTRLSADAFIWGTDISPAQAYQFARGEPLIVKGKKVRLRRPLDFLVVADHAENMGTLNFTDVGKRLFKQMEQEPEGAERGIGLTIKLFDTEDLVPSQRQSIWHRVTALADDYNDPGKFTAFIGYEWSSFGASYGDQRLHLHRVVVFKDDAEKANQVIPFTNYDSDKPKDLWRYLARYEEQTGGSVLAIPHNPNLSNGRMFSLSDSDGQALTTRYAETRSRWEPLVEVTQMKGDSETHPLLSPNDEFADFEKFIFAGKALSKKELQAKRYEYARSALKLGLDQQAKLGVNPFKFGMIGSTDSHTALASAREDNYRGVSIGEGELDNTPTSYRITSQSVFGTVNSAAGYAAVWAKENTREAIFAAMQRKEAYATSGPRMTVRFFGGWDFHENDAYRPIWQKLVIPRACLWAQT